MRFCRGVAGPRSLAPRHRAFRSNGSPREKHSGRAISAAIPTPRRASDRKPCRVPAGTVAEARSAIPLRCCSLCCARSRLRGTSSPRPPSPAGRRGSRPFAAHMRVHRTPAALPLHKGRVQTRPWALSREALRAQSMRARLSVSVSNPSDPGFQPEDSSLLPPVDPESRFEPDSGYVSGCPEPGSLPEE